MFIRTIMIIMIISSSIFLSAAAAGHICTGPFVLCSSGMENFVLYRRGEDSTGHDTEGIPGQNNSHCRHTRCLLTTRKVCRLHMKKHSKDTRREGFRLAHA